MKKKCSEQDYFSTTNLNKFFLSDKAYEIDKEHLFKKKTYSNRLINVYTLKKFF